MTKGTGEECRRSLLVSHYGESVVESLEAVTDYCGEAALVVAKGRVAFGEDILLQRSVEAIIDRIGDTIRRQLPARFLAAFPGQPWQDIVAMRIRMAHIDAENDPDIMWVTIVRDVPKLRRYIDEEILGRGTSVR